MRVDEHQEQPLEQLDVALTARLLEACKPVYRVHINHSLKTREYERSCNDMTGDPTRVQTGILNTVKNIMGPMFDGYVITELSDMGEVSCKVFRGPAGGPSVLVSQFSISRPT